MSLFVVNYTKNNLHYFYYFSFFLHFKNQTLTFFLMYHSNRTRRISKTQKNTFYKRLFTFSIVLFFICIIIDIRPHFVAHKGRNKLVLAIYNPLFGNIENDQKYIGWKCKKYINSDSLYEAPSELPIKLYPQRKLYSTHDKNILIEQMQELKSIGVDGIIIKWYGIGRTSEIFNEGDDSFAIKSIDLLVEACKAKRMKFSIFLQNYPEKENKTISNDIEYIIRKWMQHSNYLKNDGRPMVFVKEPFKTQIFHAINNFRGKNNIFFVSTFSQLEDIAHSVDYNFEAVCALPNYQFSTYSAKYDKWKNLQKEAHDRGLIFFPVVSPGYNISITSNGLTQMKLKSRKGGDKYQAMFSEALNTNDGIIIINSYNDWIEGTNIEPAIEEFGMKYSDSLWTGAKGTPTDFLDLTKAYIKKFK